MLVFLKTWWDVIALRKGPDATPASWISLAVAGLIFLLGWLMQLAIYGVPREVIAPALGAYGVALAAYALVCILFGFPSRVLQMIATVIACGSMIAVASTAAFAALAPLAGARAAAAAAQLIWLWSIPVKGHIVARTIEKHWFFGIAIAMMVFILRFSVESAGVSTDPAGTS